MRKQNLSLVLSELEDTVAYICLQQRAAEGCVTARVALVLSRYADDTVFQIASHQRNSEVASEK